MSYDEKRISDLIDGGIQKENELFKGTKGKWELYFDDRSLEKYIKTENVFIAEVGFGNEEKNANALLISKAPELLQKLDELQCLMEYLDEWSEERKSIRQLIKQATEL